MYYKEFLRVRSLFVVFAITIASLTLLIFLLGSHAKFSAGPDTPPKTAQHTSTAGAGHAADVTNVSAPGVEVTTSDHTPYAILFAIAGFVAAIFATIAGTCLAGENCGHLEVAWTRPASRSAYAMRLMLVDVAGIAAIYLFALLVGLAFVYASDLERYMYAGSDTWPMAVRFILYPLAWFGLVIGLTASVRNRAGAIAGFSWLGMMLLAVLPAMGLPPAITATARFLNYVNPLMYGSYSTDPHGHVLSMGATAAAGGLIGISILGIAAALVQWRRLEA